MALLGDGICAACKLGACAVTGGNRVRTAGRSQAPQASWLKARSWVSSLEDCSAHRPDVVRPRDCAQRTPTARKLVRQPVAQPLHPRRLKVELAVGAAAQVKEVAHRLLRRHRWH